MKPLTFACKHTLQISLSHMLLVLNQLWQSLCWIIDLQSLLRCPCLHDCPGPADIGCVCAHVCTIQDTFFYFEFLECSQHVLWPASAGPPVCLEHDRERWMTKKGRMTRGVWWREVWKWTCSSQVELWECGVAAGADLKRQQPSALPPSCQVTSRINTRGCDLSPHSDLYTREEGWKGARLYRLHIFSQITECSHNI